VFIYTPFIILVFCLFLGNEVNKFYDCHGMTLIFLLNLQCNLFMSQANGGCLSKNIMEQTVEKVNGEFFPVNGKITVARDQCHDTPGVVNTSLSELPPEATSGSSLSTEDASPKSRGPVISACPQGHDRIVKSEEMIMQLDSHREQGVMPRDNNGPSSSACPTSVKIKDEPWDNSEIHNVNEDVMGSISIKLPVVKSEQEIHSDFNDEQVENMCLTDRLNFLMSRKDTGLNIPMSYSSLKKTMPSSSASSSNFSESAEPSRIKCARKRKKTATYYPFLLHFILSIFPL